MSKKLKRLQAAIDAITPRSTVDRYVFTIELRQPWKDKLRALWCRSPGPFEETEVEAFVQMLLIRGLQCYERELDAQDKADAAECAVWPTGDDRQGSEDENEISF